MRQLSRRRPAVQGGRRQEPQVVQCRLRWRDIQPCLSLIVRLRFHQGKIPNAVYNGSSSSEPNKLQVNYYRYHCFDQNLWSQSYDFGKSNFHNKDRPISSPFSDHYNFFPSFFIFFPKNICLIILYLFKTCIQRFFVCVCVCVYVFSGSLFVFVGMYIVVRLTISLGPQ